MELNVKKNNKILEFIFLIRCHDIIYSFIDTLKHKRPRQLR